MKKNVCGLTIIEVVVAMALLAILGAALVGVVPSLARNTRASTIDTGQSQAIYGIFEVIAEAWSNETPYGEETVGADIPLEDFVADTTGEACTVVVSDQPPDVQPTRKRVVITCGEVGGLPDRVLRAEFGDPGGGTQ